MEYWEIGNWEMGTGKWNGGILEIEELGNVLGLPVVQLPLEPATRGEGGG